MYSVKEIHELQQYSLLSILELLALMQPMICSMHISGMFTEIDIEKGKVDIEGAKVDI